MKRKLIVGILVCIMSISLMACDNTTDEKISQVQSKYNQLVEIHNKAVDAHSQITDSFLDEELSNLASGIETMKTYNLLEMTEEEMEVVIADMDISIQEYEKHLISLTEQMQSEADLQMFDIRVTLINQTGLKLQEIYIYPESAEQGENILNENSVMANGETLAGITLKKNVKEIPWELLLSDGNGKTWTVELPVDNMGEEGVTVILKYNSDEDDIIFS